MFDEENFNFDDDLDVSSRRSDEDVPMTVFFFFFTQLSMPMFNLIVSYYNV